MAGRNNDTMMPMVVMTETDAQASSRPLATVSAGRARRWAMASRSGADRDDTGDADDTEDIRQPSFFSSARAAADATFCLVVSGTNNVRLASVSRLANWYSTNASTSGRLMALALT